MTMTAADMARAPSQAALFGGNSAPRAYAPSRLYSAKPNGYAATPGSGPADQTCGTCANCRQRTVHGKHFYKCVLMVAAWSRDRITDIVLKSPACSRHQPGTPHATTVVPKPERD